MANLCAPVHAKHRRLRRMNGRKKRRLPLHEVMFLQGHTKAGAFGAVIPALLFCLIVGLAAGQARGDLVTAQLGPADPMAGPAPSQFRWKDIADNLYQESYRTSYDYADAVVSVQYEEAADAFQGTLTATGLKPNFAYQIKIVTNPTAKYVSELTAYEYQTLLKVGSIGRWWDFTTGTINPSYDPEHQMQSYLLFEHFETDNFGNAAKDFYADSSFHVLFTGSGLHHPVLSTVDPGGPPPNDIAYSEPYPESVDVTVGAQAEGDRPPPGSAFLPAGHYEGAVLLLTEESFHQSGLGGYWASAMYGYIVFDIGGCIGDADCDDGNVCTTDTCDVGDGFCDYEDLTGPVCDDGLFCNGPDTCSEGTCSVHDGDPCASLICDETADLCGDCGTDVDCDDENVCTTDTCDTEDDSCDYESLTGPACDDGLFCTVTDTCVGGVCVGSGDPCVPLGLICDDTADACHECLVDGDCSDGQFCNAVEICNSGTCGPGVPPDCDDGDGSTIDYCDSAAGACRHTRDFDPDDGTITDSMWPSGMELGGIGVGKLEVRTNGEIGNYTLNNNWDKWVERTKGSFFAVHVNNSGIKTNRILRRSYSGGSEYTGVDAIEHVRYAGMFPKLEIEYYDGLPISLELNAFSPLIPQNPSDSRLPVAFVTFDVTNETSNDVDVSLAFSWENILGRGGYDTWSHGSQTWSSVNGNYQQNVDLTNLQGVRLQTTQSHGDVRDNSVGEYLLLAEKGAGLEITTHNSWNVLDATPSFWSNFEDTGTLTDPTSPPSGSDGSYEPAGTVAVKTSLAPSENKQIRFMVVWYMPTHITDGDGINHGHAYLSNPATDTPDEIAEYAHGNLTTFLDDTSEWQDLVLNSNLPFWLKLRMINGAFTMFANSVYPQDHHFYTHESLISMRGSLGTIDQRMCFHPFYTMLFPELDQDELTIFGDVRPGDGRVSHFNGNVGWKLHSSDVGYGVTNWPDLSCSYVMQVLKSYKWTGDMTFLDDNWTEVQGVMTWLQNADGDGDSIPEGGSTYDYEGQNPGAFVYTASAYLGALKAAEEMARIKGNTTLADSYAARFTNAQNTVMTNLWTGSYLRKYQQPGGATTDNSFIASLAGDWLSRYSTTGRTLDVDVAKSAENHILNWHQDLFPGVVAPMEVAPDGDDPAGNCYQYQHEPYIGMQSIYDGYVDEGLGILYSIYEDHWEKAHWPWNGRIHPSVYGSGKTSGWNGDYYMSNPATWGVLNALSGSSLDVPNETLYLAPHLPAGWTELHIPLFFPKFWASLNFDHTTGQVDLEIVKVFVTPITISKTIAELASGSVVENTTEGLPFTASLGQVLTYYIPVDNTAPAAVSDLAAGWTGSQVQLSWTAPGDDADTGRSLRYDVRYSLGSIDDLTWDQATPVTREPYPASAGTSETFLVPDSLTPGTTYYFALKSKDEEGNWSALSNVDDVFTGGGECDTDDDCDDGIDCTDNTCVDHECVFTPNDALCPDDGLFCNGDEVCDAVDSCIHSGDPCNDGVTCTDDTCDEDTDTCTNTPNDADCPDDGLFCNGTEFCDETLDCSHTGSPCQPGETCDEETDTCTASELIATLPQDYCVVDCVDVGDALLADTETGHGIPGVPPHAWSPIEPLTHAGVWGGKSNYPDDHFRTIWGYQEGDAPGDGDREADVTLDFGPASTNKKLGLNHLDGGSDDSFEIYVDGDPTPVGSYADQGPTETWYQTWIDLGPLTGTHLITIKATGSAGSFWNPYGQGAIDEIATATTNCGVEIPAGFDCFETTAGSTWVEFGGDSEVPPIPADFFGPGSDPFDGVVALRGDPLGGYPGAVSTVVERKESATMPGPVPVEIELVELSLVSTSPITVTFNGGTNPTLYDVTVTLADTPPSTGSVIITEIGPDGGVFESSAAQGGGLYLHPKFIFDPVEQGASVELEDPGYSVLLETAAPYLWQYETPALFCLPDQLFYPVPGQELVIVLDGGASGSHGNIPPREVDGCCLPDGTCINIYPDDCTFYAGTPQGAPCSGTLEACCLPHYTCVMADPLCCDDLGGVSEGPGSSCDPNPCPECLQDADCDDGLFCSGAETCDASGDCQPGTSPCDDGVACTDDDCDEGTETCTNTANDANCNDTLFCNGVETCAPSDPASGPDGCLAGADPCPDQLCDEDADECVDYECLVDDDCEDGIDCTDDTCVDHDCLFTPDDALCTDDGLFCNGTEFCDAALDCSHTGNPCQPDEFCNETAGACQQSELLTASYPTSLPGNVSATPAFVALPGGAVVTDYVDIGLPSSEAGHNMVFTGDGAWGPIVGTDAGGSGYGGIDHARVIWEPGSGDEGRSATVDMNFGSAPVNKYVALRWLDGSAYDSFTLEVESVGTTYVVFVDPDYPGGDPDIGEDWRELGICDLGVVIGVRTLTLTATAAAWSGHGTYGQVTFDEVAVFRAPGECLIDDDCDDEVFCNGDETCLDGTCVDGAEPCQNDCEQCNEQDDTCDWCALDLDQAGGVIGTGDFGIFSGCFGLIYPPGHPSYDNCLESNFDDQFGEQACGAGSDPDCYVVGTGDFGVFSGCFALTCGDCANCWGPGGGRDEPKESDGAASVQLVAVRVPTPADVVDILPKSSPSFVVGQTFYLELWASGGRTVDGVEDGLAAVYVDVEYDAPHLTVEQIIPGSLFSLLSYGVIGENAGLVRSLGGCASLGEGTLGTDSTWVRVATLEMRVWRPGRTVLQTGPSVGAFGIAIFNRFGDLDASQVEFGRRKLKLSKLPHHVEVESIRSR